MSTVNWDEVKFRASSFGNLMAEPQTKAAKEAGELSKSCQRELIRIYNQAKYGRKKDIVTKQMDKGIQAEEASISLFSIAEGKLFYKNEDQLENEWFTGHPDIFIGDHVQNAEEIWDIKSRYELDTFMPKLIEDIDKGEELQLQIYFSLTGAKSGGIANTLVSMPENLLMEQKMWLLKSMNVISEESPEYKKAAEELEKNLVFEDIDYRERVIKQPVARNDELIEKMKAKVPIMRNWLADLEKRHMRLYPKE